MSKNTDRYKEDISHFDIEAFDEIETPKFEKFKNKKATSQKDKHSKKSDEGKKPDR